VASAPRAAAWADPAAGPGAPVWQIGAPPGRPAELAILRAMAADGGGQDEGARMKSAYDLALERLEREGIERPREDALTDEVRREMAEVRSRAEAKIAELEILHRDRLARLYEPEARQQEGEDYRRERRRIEEDRDRKLDALRRREEAGVREPGTGG